MTNFNIILNQDSYKYSQYKMYDPKMQYMYSYFEPRTGAKHDQITFFGLQYIIRKFLSGKVVTQEKIDEAAEICKHHFGNPDLFNVKGWQYILDEHNGYLPIAIFAIPEYAEIEPSNVMFSIVNTDPKCAWLVNFLETMLMQVWYPCTVASEAGAMKRMIKYHYNKSCESLEGSEFAVHNFGLRACTSPESAAIAAAAHLIYFQGSDSISGIQFLQKYYDKPLNEINCYAPPASEHSVMTSRGRENEFKVFSDILDAYPEGLVSVVIDSYDAHNFVSDYAMQLKDKILARNGKTVFRPDSGDPVSESVDIIERLDKIFGHSVNKRGYKVLNPKVGVIWGDGIDITGMDAILTAVEEHGWAANNIVFGCGGKLNQCVNRDTERFAGKCSAACIDGVWKDVYKDPVTSNRKGDFTKASKRGLQVYSLNKELIKGYTNSIPVEGKKMNLEELYHYQLDGNSLMKLVFENGKEIK